jgi:hypothetical protein
MRCVIPPEVSMSVADSALGDSGRSAPERRSVASTSKSPRVRSDRA